MEGQQLTSVVSELGVDAQQTAVTVEISERLGELLLRAVYLAQIQEGRQRVDLLSLFRFPAKIVGGVS